MSPPELASRVGEAANRLTSFLQRTQISDGSWSVPYTGPNFLLPLYVITTHLTRRPIPEGERPRFVAGLLKPQLPDGSIGLHEESTQGAVFTSSISYAALRLLGENPDRPELERMRGWIHASGTPIKAAAWGKFILALLNLYPWSGVTPVPPELYLLPQWFPLQPINISGYVRIVYLPMPTFTVAAGRHPSTPCCANCAASSTPKASAKSNGPNTGRTSPRPITLFRNPSRSAFSCPWCNGWNPWFRRGFGVGP